MALTTLDPITALIVVDLQAGLAGAPFVHPFADVVARARALLNAFRRRGLPVVLVNVDGVAPGRTERPRHNSAFPDGWTDLLPELDRQPGDIVVYYGGASHVAIYAGNGQIIDALNSGIPVGYRSLNMMPIHSVVRF